MRRRSAFALAGAAAGLAAGVVGERFLVQRKRAHDPEALEAFGARRGIRARRLARPDGAMLFVEEIGSRADAGTVFIHGSTLRTDQWYYQMDERLAGDRRLVFFDLRGHGLSRPKGEAPYTMETLADDLLAVIEDCRLKEVVLVGHSVGGMIAMTLCLQRPDLQGTLIRGLGLLNSTYGPAIETLIGGAAVARVERAVRRPLDALGGHAHRLDYLRNLIRPSDALFWGVAFAAFGPHASAKQIDYTYDMVAETSSDVILDLIRSYRGFDARDRLGEISVPCLVVAGDHDKLTLPEASEYLATHLPKAELQVLEGTGHMSMLERHEEVNELLGRFIEDVLGSGDER